MNIRDEIELTIKTCNINRLRFFEVAKQSYQDVLDRITDHFVDKTSDWKNDIHWANMGYYKPELRIQYYNLDKENISRDDFRRKLLFIVPTVKYPVWFLVEGTKNYTHKYWVYEGYVPEISMILNETSFNDFYIVSKKYEWLISINHHNILSLVGENLTFNHR